MAPEHGIYRMGQDVGVAMVPFVRHGSIVRRIWGDADTILFVFAGSAAEFALNRAVDWLFHTGKLPEFARDDLSNKKIVSTNENRQHNRKPGHTDPKGRNRAATLTRLAPGR